jgi:hypothetical protein
MPDKQDSLEAFRTEDGWKYKYGRVSLPVLVSLAERYKGRPDADMSEFTYGDLASIVADKNYAHPIHHALGAIGFALAELSLEPGWKFGRVPPIQLLVWSQGLGHPGEDGFGFIGIGKEEFAALSVAGRQNAARKVRSDILDYPRWREVLAALGLEPRTLKLPEVRQVIESPSPDHGGGPESEYHRRFKCYLASHYDSLGLQGEFQAQLEVKMISGDRADLMLDHALGGFRVCVEVKSRLSPEGDLIRGIFQCVKYQAILMAQEKYEAARGPAEGRKTVDVLLAVEQELSDELRSLCDLVNVKALVVRVPNDYEPPSAC